MSNEQIIIEDTNYKFSIFDSVPKPSQGTACILYRKNQRNENILVITPQKPVLSSQVRSGGFDMKLTISTASRNYGIQKQIVDKSGNFHFIVNINLSYEIKSIEYVFKNQCWDFDEVIERNILQMLSKYHKCYDIEDGIELENDLREQIVQMYDQKINYLRILGSDINVDMDDRAKTIIDSNLDTMVDTVLLRNEGDKESIIIAEKERTETLKLEAEQRIEKERGKVTLEKAHSLNAIKEELGDNYTAFMAYANGEISGVELDDRMRNNRNADMSSKILALKQLVELDIISGQALEGAALKLLGEKNEVSSIEQKEHEEIIGEDVIVEDVEEY